MEYLSWLYHVEHARKMEPEKVSGHLFLTHCVKNLVFSGTHAGGHLIEIVPVPVDLRSIEHADGGRDHQDCGNLDLGLYE